MEDSKQTIEIFWFSVPNKFKQTASVGKVMAKRSRGQVCSCSRNAVVQTDQVAVAESANCDFELLPHSPYSPDKAPSDFFL